MFKKGNVKKDEIINKVNIELENSNFNFIVFSKNTSITSENMDEIRSIARNNNFKINIIPNKLFNFILSSNNIKFDSKKYLNKENIVIFSKDAISTINFSKKLPRSFQKLFTPKLLVSDKVVIFEEQDINFFSKINSKNDLYINIINILQNSSLQLCKVINERIKQLEA